MIAQWVEVTQLPKEACVTDQCTHKPRESDLVALIQWTHQMILLCSPCLHLFFILCTLRFLPWLPPTAHIPARSLPSIPVLGVHLFLSIQAILSSDPEAYPGYLHKARGSFCHISEQENQFNKYLLSTYSVSGTISGTEDNKQNQAHCGYTLEDEKQNHWIQCVIYNICYLQQYVVSVHTYM